MEATIFCYTTTGNSLYIANRIADKIGAEVLPVTRKKTTCGSSVVGIVYPSFFWGLPRMVSDFLNNLELTGDKPYIFAVYTYGGGAPFSAGAVSKSLKSKDNRLAFCSYVKTVENYIPSFKVKDNHDLWNSADEKIDKISACINSRKISNFIFSTIANTLYHRTYPGFVPECDSHFSVSDACNSCGLCSRLCQAKNIQMVNGKPYFIHNCDHCLSCLNNCPQNAIDWKNKTHGKQRYKNSHIAVSDILSFQKLSDK